MFQLIRQNESIFPNILPFKMPHNSRKREPPEYLTTLNSSRKKVFIQRYHCCFWSRPLKRYTSNPKQAAGEKVYKSRIQHGSESIYERKKKAGVLFHIHYCYIKDRWAFGCPPPAYNSNSNPRTVFRLESFSLLWRTYIIYKKI